MTEVISVKFKNRGKSYYFAPEGVTASAGDHVIVETAKGLEFADCVEGNHEVPDESVVKPLRRPPRMICASSSSTKHASRRPWPFAAARSRSTAWI